MKTKIGIIGGGNMGEAIVKGIRHKYSVCVCEVSARRRKYLKRTHKIHTGHLSDVIQCCSVIILAVKPQNIEGVLTEMKKNMTKSKLVISIAAGITSAYIEKKLGKGMKVIRTMPNMPAQIGEGITAISKGRYATRKDVATAKKIFDQIGYTVILQEKLIDAVTAVSGSGPAYVFYFVECLMKAAQSLGLNKSLSKDLVYATVMGSNHLLLLQKSEAAQLRAKVTSKGGTTQAALNVLMKKKTDKIFKEALLAAKKRAKELSKR